MHAGHGVVLARSGAGEPPGRDRRFPTGWPRHRPRGQTPSRDALAADVPPGPPAPSLSVVDRSPCASENHTRPRDPCPVPREHRLRRDECRHGPSRVLPERLAKDRERHPLAVTPPPGACCPACTVRAQRAMPRSGVTARPPTPAGPLDATRPGLEATSWPAFSVRPCKTRTSIVSPWAQ